MDKDIVPVNSLIGKTVLTRATGNELGEVYDLCIDPGDIYIQLIPPPHVIYEVRESVFDKLLGRSFFMFASAGSALSNNAERIVVPNATAANAASNLADLSSRPKPASGNAAIIAGGEDENETVIHP